MSLIGSDQYEILSRMEPARTAEEGDVQQDLSKKILDVYDLEFLTNMEIAKNLVDKMGSYRDKNLAKKWIKKARELLTPDVTTKKNRNGFFKYFLQILHKATEADIAGGGGSELDEKVKDGSGRDFTCRWSADKRTYIAAKPLPGEGTLVYLAVSKDPSLGWNKQGETVYV